MSVRPPSPPALASLHRRTPACSSARRVWPALALTVLVAGLSACSARTAIDIEESDGGPCGRGKARSCECEDGERGIAQCLVGGDWSACHCGSSSYDFDEGKDDGGRREVVPSPKPNDQPLGGPKSNLACDESFDVRAHSADSKTEPYLVPSGLPAAGGPNNAVCFYFRAPFLSGAQAVAFQPLRDETTQPHHWRLFGVDSAKHADGEVGPCNGAEPGAYLLASFNPASEGRELPPDVGLVLPSGETAGLVLEVHYADTGLTELLDRTGVRVCTSGSVARDKAAAVHFLGTEGICVPPAHTGYEVVGSCSPRADQGDIHILNVAPHMHRLGRHMQVNIRRRDGRVEVLHDEPFYYLGTKLEHATDVVISPGDTLETRCTYENDTIMAVPFGEKTSDEMCFAFVTAWPAGALSVDPLTLDPLRTLSVGVQASRRCLDPIGILGSCNGFADSPY